MPAPSRSGADALSPSEALGQRLRCAGAGAGVTLFSALVYMACATRFGVPPLLANTVSTALGVMVGYLVHSRWSFQAAADNERLVMARFLLAAAGAFLLNSFWVWLAVHALRLPAWTPITGMIFATPLASFAVNRYWVFA